VTRKNKVHVDNQEGLAQGISEGGRGDGCIFGHGRFVRVWLASSRASLLLQGMWSGRQFTKLQMQQSPHLAGFVVFGLVAGVI